MRRFWLGALLALALIPVLGRAATQQVQYPGQEAQTQQTNAVVQNDRDALGVTLYDFLNTACGASSPFGGCTSGLTVTPVSGQLEVTVDAGSAGGRVYQVVESNPSPMPAATPLLPAGASPIPAATLPPDTQAIIVPAFQNGNSAVIGPLTAPSISGQSIDYLIEYQVTPSVPGNLQVAPFWDGAPWTTSVDLALSDTITYQAKAGTSGTSPSPPPVDSGWGDIATVNVPYGATSCAASCTITQVPALGGIPLLGLSNTFTQQNTFSADQTLGARGTATSSTNYSSFCLWLQNSIWTSGSPATNTWKLCSDTSSHLNFNFDGTIEAYVDTGGDFHAPNYYATALTPEECVSLGSTYAMVSGTWCITSLSAGTGLSSSGGTSPTLSLIVPVTNADGGTNTVSSWTGCVGDNGTSYAHSNCYDTLGTGLSGSGTTASLTVPVTNANGGTNTTSSWTGCVGDNGTAYAHGNCYDAYGDGLTASGTTLAVNNCGASICRSKLEMVLGAESGTVSTADGFYTIPIVGFSNGQITGIRAFCTGLDNGTTVVTLYTVNSSTGAETSVGTLTLSSSTYESDGSITAVNLSPPEGLTASITTAGTASGCTIVAEGYQDVY